MSIFTSELETKLQTLVSSELLLAIKAEFEAEGTRIDELAVLSQICCRYSVPLTLKIGGPTAQRDMYEAFQLGATNILVPMLESSFALKLCLQSYEHLSHIFLGLKQLPTISINIESKLGLKNLEDILSTIKELNYPIHSIVIGRSDLSSSLGSSDVDSESIYQISESILKAVNLQGLHCTLGGNLTTSSFDFIHDLSEYNLYAFESRKCTFKSSCSLTSSKYSTILRAGLEFELAWLNFKSKLYSNRSMEESKRISIIHKRISG